MNQIYHGDCLEVMDELIAKGVKVDAIITDPPYGIGLGEWDKKIDIEKYVSKCYQILNDNSYFVWFGQMPTMIDWINESKKHFNYVDHISWVKRTQNPSKGIGKSFENIFIFSKGKPKYNQTYGKYVDVKLPGILVDTITIDSVTRYIQDLHLIIRTGKAESPRQKKYTAQKEYTRLKGYTGTRAKEDTNFTNVWSFLPQNQKTRDGSKKHPTQKPAEILERLLQLCTKENNLVLDTFGGSGTTGVACQNTNRNYILIEKDDKYFEIMKNRLLENQKVLETQIF